MRRLAGKGLASELDVLENLGNCGPVCWSLEEHMLPTDQAKALADEDATQCEQCNVAMGTSRLRSGSTLSLRDVTFLTKLATFSKSLETRRGCRWWTRRREAISYAQKRFIVWPRSCI